MPYRASAGVFVNTPHSGLLADGVREWIALLPQGYYSASAHADRYLNVSIGNRNFTIGQWRATFNKPQIVSAAMRLGDAQRAVDAATPSGSEALSIQSESLPEPPAVIILAPSSGGRLATANTILSVRLEDRSQGLKSARVLVNGKEIFSTATRGLVHPGWTPNQKAFDLRTPVSLDGGENLIEVIAFNGIAEARGSVRVYGPDTAGGIMPNLWLLAIGINHYESDRLVQLRYAVDDAEAIANAFERQKGRLFRDVHTRLITDRSAIRPTYENILDNLDFLKQAGQNDIVLLFVAGHGVNDESGDFFILPSDASFQPDGSVRRSRAVAGRELKALLDLPARKLVMIDACHSEGVSGRRTRGVDTDQLVRELRESDAVVFTSSRSREFAQESEEWRHGAFTYAILKGLEGGADFFKDGIIKIKALDAFVSETRSNQLANGPRHGY